MRLARLGRIATALCAAAIAGGGLAAAQTMDLPVIRGAYLTQIMDCQGCHTPGTLAGEPNATRALAGSEVGFELPGLGIFYPPNLTPDHETGLGGWSDAEIVHALRTGERPDGRVLAPIMPYRSYAGLTEEDAAAIVAYLRSLPPVQHKVPGPFGPDEKPTAPYMTIVRPQ